MTAARTIDVHAHILDAETIKLIQKDAPKAGFRLTRIDEESGTLDFGGKVVTPFPRGGWDLERRLHDMDKHGYDVQVLSICPFTFCYWLEPELTLAVSQIQNDQMAALAKRMPDRFMSIATLPMQSPKLAADEMRRAMTKLGMRGIQIGSMVNGRNLDDPALEPVWSTAEELGAFILIHPQNAVGVPGVESYYLKNLIGNPLDSTVAAAALIFGGVLERHPRLNICMVHGGGFAPYQVARWVHGWEVRPEPKVNLKGSPQASFDKLYFDTILHASKPLEFLVDLVGSSRVLLGTDYPFDMGQYDLGIVNAISASDGDKANILRNNAMKLIGEAGPR